MSHCSKPASGALPNYGHPLFGGLGGLWPMNESGGNTIYDLSGNGNNGTLLGGADWEAGKFGPAIDFHTTNDERVVITNTANKLDIPTTMDFTISIWFKFTSFTGTQILAVNGDTNNRYQLGMQGSVDELRWRIRDNSTNYDIDISNASTAYPVGTWHHAIAGREGSNTFFSVDGVAQSPQAMTITATYGSDMVLGIGFGLTAIELQGSLDNYMFYKRALSASEKQQLYLNPFILFDRDPIELWVGSVGAGAPPAATTGIMTTNTGFWGGV